MMSRFFKRKPKPKAEPPARKAAPKKATAAHVVAPKQKPVVSKKTSPLELAAPKETTPHFAQLPSKPGKLITAEGWKRLMMRRSEKK